MSARTVAIIPARLASTRFPGKMLACETGRPLVQHVVDAVRRCPGFDGPGAVVVAADDPSLRDALAGFGTSVVLTASGHANGTSRLAEAAALLGLDGDDVIVNVQGDEPEIEPRAIEAAVTALARPASPTARAAHVGTVATPLVPPDRPEDRNIVKVVRALDGGALYFSRAPIPCARDGCESADASPLRHVGLYAYRRRFLEQYVALPPTPLEGAEQLEQLRVLEHGYRVAVAVVPGLTGTGIDTPEQYRAFVARHKARGR
ncbi:MAG TPA: 3-deoxy-manno-octulosonate cytidylyltransferase [Phycisphaerales bacterium]|nr:3-deoxy-manno-octulosonate cytidylyltransferase [Phycisphaerales bacterium]